MTEPVLILFAHPAFHRSRANRALRVAAEGVEGVTVHDLYETYPDYLIDVDAEQARLDAHRHLIFLHPFYWYSAPSLLKEWLDLVLTHGWAYGEGGRSLTGKTWTQAITTGGPARAYGPDGINRFSIEELLRPFEATAHLCGCRWQEPFVVHSSRLADADTLFAQAQGFARRLRALTETEAAR
jgi:glutathione-regulated potassium-efflux system ancillary protein KefG